jgi:WD40 repeat protein
LTDAPAEQLAMSADAQTIVFTRPVSGGYTLWAVPAKGGNAYPLSPVVLTEAPVLSPDATRMAIPRADGVLVCDVPDCSNQVVLPITTLVGWTPDGSSLTHTGAPGGANIWATRIADGSMRQVTRFNSQVVTSIAWSADGRRIAVTRQRTLADLVLLAPLP